MADNASPDGAELASPDLVLGPVHEAHTLAKVELSGRLVPDVLDLEKRGMLMLVAKPPLETQHDALHVQPVVTNQCTQCTRQTERQQHGAGRGGRRTHTYHADFTSE